MKSISGKDLAKLLEEHGWELLRIQGSHHIYGKADANGRISVPIHRNQDLKIGLLRNLLKQANLLDIFQPKSSKSNLEQSEESVNNNSQSIEPAIEESSIKEITDQ
jgi:predicted RNA binding protein YcfA (HicA-like mRNA interferase family)